MRRYLVLLVLVSAIVGLTACAASAHQENSGWVGMAPYVDEESGIRGLLPQAGWPEAAELVLHSAPMDLSELTAQILNETPDLNELPQRIATYRGRSLTWDLYSSECHLSGLDPLVRVNLALSEGDSLSYFAALVVPPEAYQANPALYETVFRHAVYALEPLE